MGNAAFGCQQKTGAAFAAFQANFRYILEKNGLSFETGIPEQAFSDLFLFWEQALRYYFENLQRTGLLMSEQSQQQWFSEAEMVNICCHQHGGVVPQECTPFVVYGEQFFGSFFHFAFDDPAGVGEDSLARLLEELSVTVLRAFFVEQAACFPASQEVSMLQ